MAIVTRPRRSSSVKINPTFAHSFSVSDQAQRPDTVFPADRSQYELLFLCGTHPHSEVYVARCLSNEHQVAAKLINLDACERDLDELRRPIELWQMNAHPNMLNYYTSFVSDSVLWCVSEYMDGGSIADIMAFGYPHGFSDENIIASIIHSVLHFLDYFHVRFQMHRRIRPSKIFLAKDGHIKIGDLGSAETLISDGQRRKARFSVIESAYAAPELLTEGAGHNEKSDIWSLGISVIEMATGMSPYAGMDVMPMVQSIINGPPPALPALHPNEKLGHSPAIRDFVRLCLQMDPDARPSAEQLLKHAFIKKAGAHPQVRGLAENLPPLHERFQAINQTKLGRLSESSSGKPLWAVCDFDLGEIGAKSKSQHEQMKKLKKLRSMNLPRMPRRTDSSDRPPIGKPPVGPARRLMSDSAGSGLLQPAALHRTATRSAHTEDDDV
jgi:serine/threonine protein kinase